VSFGELAWLSFGHRVKNILMASFNEKELEDLEDGGNLVAKKYWLANWDGDEFPRPVDGDPHAMLSFMKAIYEEKQFVNKHTAPATKKKTAAVPKKLNRSQTEKVLKTSKVKTVPFVKKKVVEVETSVKPEVAQVSSEMVRFVLCLYGSYVV
jgi:hypothetical protein